jgi:ParB family transcriptional regulator, chromosome partitioning protein
VKKKEVIELGLTDILSGSLGANLMNPVTSLHISEIITGKYQPRSDFKEEELERLALSIKEQGVLQPIIVREAKDIGKFELIAGERRLRASKICGLEEIPVVCLDLDEDQAHIAGLVENVQRENLNPIEEAESYRNIIDRLGLTHEEFSNKIGFKRSAITNMLRLLSLESEVQNLIKDGLVSVGHAKLLLKLNKEQQIDVAREVYLKKLSVRDLESRIKKINLYVALPSSPMKVKEVTELQDMLKELLGVSVEVCCKNKEVANNKKIQFSDLCTLRTLIELLKI